MISMVVLHSLISSKGWEGNWRYVWNLQQWIFSTPFDPVEGMIIQFENLLPDSFRETAEA